MKKVLKFTILQKRNQHELESLDQLMKHKIYIQGNLPYNPRRTKIKVSQTSVKFCQVRLIKLLCIVVIACNFQQFHLAT